MADPFDTPGYRFALNRFPGDGVTTQWDLSFAGVSPGYISQDHVRAVLVNDTTGVETPVLLGPGNFILPTRLQITPAVPVGVTLEVRRNSPKDEPLLDYTDGALMIEKNLDTSNQQTVYAVAEMVDRFADALDDTAEFSQAVLDRLAEVEGVADGADAKADQAIATAGSAVSIANGATALANQAIETAEDAVVAVEGAEQAAILATNAANTATTAANNANAAATAATSTAADAVNTAQSAVTIAQGAVTTANNAETTANGIAGTAAAALVAAQDAVDTANGAETTANGVDAKATQALADSATALSTANSFNGRITSVEGVVRSTALPTTAHDLNTYITRGIYTQNATAGAVAGSNYPGTVKVAGTLIVCSGQPGATAANLLWQEYVTYSTGGAAGSGRRYWRTALNATGSSWSDWREIPWDTEVMRHVYLTAATDANTLIADNTFYTWITAGTAATNFPLSAPGYMQVFWGAASQVSQELTLIYTGQKPRKFARFGNSTTNTWQPWRSISAFSNATSMPTIDVGDIYVDGAGWYRWNGTAYALPITYQQWTSRAIGEIIYLDDSIAGVTVPPTDNPAFRYIRLTAGHAYNTGVLTSESVTGTAPLVSATAVVNLPGSPINGRTVRLLNTEGRILRPSASAGALQDDAFQLFTGQADVRRLSSGEGAVVGGSGAMSTVGAAGGAWAAINAPAGTALNADRLIIDPSSVARTANETRMRNLGVTAFMRIL